MGMGREGGAREMFVPQDCILCDMSHDTCMHMSHDIMHMYVRMMICNHMTCMMICMHMSHHMTLYV